jgi:hypothetical protein
LQLAVNALLKAALQIVLESRPPQTARGNLNDKMSNNVNRKYHTKEI